MNKETITDLNNRLTELLTLNHDHNITCHCFYDPETPQFLNVTYKSSEERSDYVKHKQNSLRLALAGAYLRKDLLPLLETAALNICQKILNMDLENMLAWRWQSIGCHALN